ncbi:MAG: MogA/MoaB family molybdenum cofactor biosynthesis protein [Myxococcota bacterium]
MAHEGHDHHHHHHEHHEHHHHEHHHGHAEIAVATWVVTCSDTRTAETDEGGALARQLVIGAGHSLVGSELVRDEAKEIAHALEHALEHGARCVIFTGGTGITRRDVTVETLEPRFEKRLEGFGELFRMLSFQQVGSAAWLSRATAGVVQGALVFVLPGSPKAVALALEKLILPELGHAVREMLR